jgi:pyruvate,orthophosphate dikinase
VCGEHGGDPDSIDFFESVGLDYVSCSPFRVPTARLAAAQAVIRRQPAKKKVVKKAAKKTVKKVARKVGKK